MILVWIKFCLTTLPHSPYCSSRAPSLTSSRGIPTSRQIRSNDVYASALVLSGSPSANPSAVTKSCAQVLPNADGFSENIVSVYILVLSVRVCSCVCLVRKRRESVPSRYRNPRCVVVAKVFSTFATLVPQRRESVGSATAERRSLEEVAPRNRWYRLSKLSKSCP